MAMNTPEHSPLPWRLYGLNDIQDANGNPCASGWNPDTDFTEDGQALAKADAEFIVRAVNERDTLRTLVRRFMGIVNNYPPIGSAWALLDAEEPAWRKLPAEKQAAMVSQGYKRLAALMQEAYRATGEEDA